MTRANIHFRSGQLDGANIYRHSNGSPECLGADIQDFLDETTRLKDKRWDDGEYLAAKFLVWQAAIYVALNSKREKHRVHVMEFTTVAPCLEDHGDINYRYIVQCDKADERPHVFVEKAETNDKDQLVCTPIGEIVKGEDGVITLAGKPL
jgi:hypothetical protein